MDYAELDMEMDMLEDRLNTTTKHKIQTGEHLEMALRTTNPVLRAHFLQEVAEGKYIPLHKRHQR